MTTADEALLDDWLDAWDGDGTRADAAAAVAELGRPPGCLLAAEFGRRVADLLRAEGALHAAVGPPPLGDRPPGWPAGDRYHAPRPHARGGMGEVFAAHDTALGRQVAVKLVRADRLPDADRFRAEARATARVEHPGVVPVHEAGTGADGRPYYVMRFVGGQTLLAALDAHHAAGRPPAGLRRLVERLIRAAEGVAAAHDRGLVHRDLKPANIQLDEFGQTFVLDWGLAVPPGDGGGPAGTPAYMAPEQAAGGPASAAADVFGLGATLFHLLVGRPPFAGGTPLAGPTAAQRGLVRFPRAVVRRTPADLLAVCKTATSYSPRDRYPSAAAFADDLRRWLLDEPVTARREPLLERGRRWVKRHRTAGVVGLAGLLLAVAVFAVETVRLKRAWADAEVVRAEAEAAKAEADRLRAATLEAATRLTEGLAASDGGVGLLDQFVDLVRDALPAFPGKSLAFARLRSSPQYARLAAGLVAEAARALLVELDRQTASNLGLDLVPVYDRTVARLGRWADRQAGPSPQLQAVRVAAHRGRAVARLASGDRAGAAADWDAVLSLSDPADRPRVERERAAALSPGR